MHDAVIFVVMVSLSGVVLIPALQSDTAVETSIQKHREELTDETLIMLMTSRSDDFGYTLAGQQIKEAANISIDYSNADSNDIIENLIKTFLGREQKHKTYSDLCVENLVSQLNVFGNRINIFTIDFDVKLKEELNKVLGEYLGEKYRFNLVTRWKPILGVDFGGSMEIGSTPPDTTHVAMTYASLPTTYFSDWSDVVDDYICETIDNVTSFASDEDDALKDQIENLTKNLIEKIVLYGFKNESGIVEKSVDYVFSKVEGGIESIFGDSNKMLLDPLEKVSSGITSKLTGKFFEIISLTTGLNITDQDSDGDIDCGDALDSLKGFVVDEVEGILRDVFDGYLNPFVDFIVETLDITSQINEFKQNIIDFIKDHINPLRAEFVLTIWEVRG